MKTFFRSLTAFAALGLLVSCASTPAGIGQVEAVSDGAGQSAYEVHEFGSGGTRPVLLFHMAGSNVRGEYSQIAPRLIAQGYHVFGADLRGGGDRFEATNAVASGSAEHDYCADYPGMLAAIEDVVARTGERPILIGSSYTAALVMRAAVEEPEKVAGFVSLSPAPAAGLEVCAPSALLVDLQVPGIGIRPRNEVGHEIILEQAREWSRHGVETKIVEVRSHGASALDPLRSGENAESFWSAFLWFLERADT